MSGQAKFNATLGRASSPASEKLPSLWPRQDVTFINNDKFRTSNQIRVDSHPPPLATMVVHQDTSSSRNMVLDLTVWNWNSVIQHLEA